jgi:hypothetical protein
MSTQSQIRMAIRYSLIAVIILTSIALIAEMLPEVHAKPIVLSALASALAIMLVELYRNRRLDTA